jgi:hypothetical protein
MSRARKLAIFTVVIAQGVVGVALAQADGAQPDGAQPGPDLFPPDAKPAAQASIVKVLTMEEADKLMTEMDSIVIEIQKLHSKTQQAGDELKTLCVADKLTQLQKVQAAASGLKSGIGNPATQLKASGDLEKSHAETVRLHKEALVCVGEKGAKDKDKSEGGASSESEGGGSDGEGGGDGGDGGGSFDGTVSDAAVGGGSLPPDPFVSIPPVISSGTG